MPKETGKPNERMQAWIDARKRHGLSHAEVQMARELGMNPENLRKLDNHEQETWKVPLRQFIQHLYFKRFGKERREQEGTSSRSPIASPAKRFNSTGRNSVKLNRIGKDAKITAVVR